MILTLCKLSVTEGFGAHCLGPQPPLELKELCWIDWSSQQAPLTACCACLGQEAALGQPQPPVQLRSYQLFWDTHGKQITGGLFWLPAPGWALLHGSWSSSLKDFIQGKICFSPFHLHPAEPCVSVELCSPAESRVVYQSFKSATRSLFWPHSRIPPLLFHPKVLLPDLQHVLLQFPGTVAQEEKNMKSWFPGLFGVVDCVWDGWGRTPPSLCCAANCVASLFVLSTESTDNFVSSKCLLAFEYCGWFVSIVSPSPLWFTKQKYRSQKQAGGGCTQPWLPCAWTRLLGSLWSVQWSHETRRCSSASSGFPKKVP